MIDESVDQLPAALRPREFKVGDRVIARRSTECPVYHTTPPEFDGFTAVVIEVDLDDLENDGHIYQILRPDRVPAWAASTELEPLP